MGMQLELLKLEFCYFATTDFKGRLGTAFHTMFALLQNQLCFTIAYGHIFAQVANDVMVLSRFYTRMERMMVKAMNCTVSLFNGSS
jgi:hypothetical protein